jgi:hypothetical protein
MASERKDRVQNGTISAPSDRRPDRPHTQRRFNSKEGIVPTAVAITLAHPDDSEPVATSETSTSRLSVVETADTPA